MIFSIGRVKFDIFPLKSVCVWLKDANTRLSVSDAKLKVQNKVIYTYFQGRRVKKY